MRAAAIIILFAASLMSACATTGQHAAEAVISPYTTFSGRLIVIEPARRWQVIVDWNGTPEQGVVRLTHAASNRIVKLSWHHDTTLMLDNRNPDKEWTSITDREMADNGIILPPQKLALILAGKLPETLTRKGSDEWEGKINGIFLRLKWLDEKHRLELLDITHGRKAILIIQS